MYLKCTRSLFLRFPKKSLNIILRHFFIKIYNFITKIVQIIPFCCIKRKNEIIFDFFFQNLCKRVRAHFRIVGLLLKVTTVFRSVSLLYIHISPLYLYTYIAAVLYTSYIIHHVLAHCTMKRERKLGACERILSNWNQTIYPFIINLNKH